MKAFELSEHIAKSPREVFGVISNPVEATKFLDNIKESAQLTDGPVRIGTIFRETRVVNGTEATADLVVTVHEPDTRFGIGTEAEGITVSYRYDLSPEDDGTRLDWLCELEAAGLRKMMLPMVAAIMKKEDGDHLQRLKVYLEARGPVGAPPVDSPGQPL